MTMTRALTILAICLSATMAGCLPSDEQIETDMAIERRMAYQEWKKMRDSGDSSNARVDGPLSLDDAVKIALQYNKALQSTMQSRDIARGQRVAAWNVVLPNVTVTGGATRTESYRNSLGLMNDIDNYSTSVRVTQPIMQGAAIPATLRKARFFTALTDENIRLAVQTLISDVATSYYDVLLAQHLLETNREAVISAEAQLRVVTEKRKQETATDYEVLRAQVDVAAYRADMLSQQNSIDTNRVMLLKLMGVSQDSKITFSDKLVFLPMRPVFERAVEIASGLRPELRQAELNARIQDEAVRIAQSGFWPSIAGFFEQDWNGPHDSWNRNPWSTGVSASVTLGSDTPGNVIEQKAIARQRRIEILDAQEQMLSEIHTQINNLANAEEVVKSLDVNLSASREALRLVEIGFQAGVETELDVQDSRKALTDVQAKYYTALANHTKARLQLQLAMGVLGPVKVGDCAPLGPSVPIANIEEFVATDYQPYTNESFIDSIKNAEVERPVSVAPESTLETQPPAPAPAAAVPATSAVPGSGSSVAPVVTPGEWDDVEQDLGVANAVSPQSAVAPISDVQAAAPAPLPRAVDLAVAQPQAGLSAPPMPPIAAVDAWRDSGNAVAGTAAAAPQTAVSRAPAAEQKTAPLFKITVKDSASGS